MRFSTCSKGAPEAAAWPSLPCQRTPSPGTIDIKAIIRLRAGYPAQRKQHYCYEEEPDGQSDQCNSLVQTGYDQR